jgi:hypothetical protein
VFAIAAYRRSGFVGGIYAYGIPSCSVLVLMTLILIGLSVFVLLLVGLLNRFVKRLQAQQMAELWNGRVRWRDPAQGGPRS